MTAISTSNASKPRVELPRWKRIFIAFFVAWSCAVYGSAAILFMQMIAINENRSVGSHTIFQVADAVPPAGKLVLGALLLLSLFAAQKATRGWANGLLLSSLAGASAMLLSVSVLPVPYYRVDELSALSGHFHPALAIPHYIAGAIAGALFYLVFRHGAGWLVFRRRTIR